VPASSKIELLDEIEECFKDGPGKPGKCTNAGKIVAAICIAPEILAEAGLLSGKKATAWSGSLEKLRAKGAKVENAPVVSSGRIITGNGPGAARAFGRAIAEALGK